MISWILLKVKTFLHSFITLLSFSKFRFDFVIKRDLFIKSETPLLINIICDPKVKKAVAN